MPDIWLEISTWKESRYFTDSKIVNEYDKEIPQSQTADKPMVCEEEPHNNH